MAIEKTPLKWKFKTGGRVYSPAVSDGVVYFGSGNNHLYAVDAETGEEKWKFESGDSICSSPKVSDGVVYFGSGDNHLYALDAKTGEEKWKFGTRRSVRSIPAVSDGMVYFGSNDKHLYAVDIKTGKEKWKFDTGRYIIYPVVSDKVVYCGSNDKIRYENVDGYLDYNLVEHLYALDIKTGEENWKLKTGSPVNSFPAVSDGVFYWSSDDKHLYAVDIKTGKEKWKFETGSETPSSPAVSEGVVYFGVHTGSPDFVRRLYAVDINTKKEKWRFGNIDGFVNGLTLSEGMVYFGGGNNLYAVDIQSALVLGKEEQNRQEEADKHGLTVEDIRVKYISGEITLKEAIELRNKEELEQKRKNQRNKFINTLLKRDLVRAVWNEADTAIFSQTYKIEVTHDQAWDVIGEKLEDVDPDADDYDPEVTEMVKINVGNVIDYDIKQSILDHFTIDDLDSGVVSKKDIEDCIFGSLSGLCSSFRNTPIYEGDDDTLYLEVETPILSMEDLNPEWTDDEYNLDDEMLADYIDDIM